MHFKLPSPGSSLNNGRYKIIRELNTGGTAVVYEAYDKEKNRRCALKVMNLTARQFEVAMKLSRREVVFSSTIHHDNFVQLLDVFSEGQQLVLVWELVSGLDLLDLLNQCGGKMPEAMAAYYFHQLLQGVLFMHDKGFCHRDLKAENCMIVKSTQKLKIIDFGLARQLECAVTSTTGTPDYLAPELLCTTRADRDKIDQRTVDVWATGVILYLLVTGTYPFEDPNDPNCFVQVFKNITDCNIRPLPDHVSMGCRDLIDSIFEVNPMKRIKLQELSENSWLRENARQYADQVSDSCPLVEPQLSSKMSIKNLMQRLPGHKMQASMDGLSSPEGEAILLTKSRRGLSADQVDEFIERDARSRENDQIRSFTCGVRGMLSKFCFSLPTDDPRCKKSSTMSRTRNVKE
eukprot:g8503.t1